MSLLSHEKQLITSLKKFAARIDDWLKADEKLPSVEAVSNDKTVAGDDDKKRGQKRIAKKRAKRKKS